MKRKMFLGMVVMMALFAACDNGRPKMVMGPGSPRQDNKNVLVISSSSRRGGNSDLLCDRFMEGAQAAGHQVEKVFLNDLNIRFLLTNDNYEDRNLRNPADEAPAVVDKMIRADVIVMATPIYYYNMSGQMKTMIDRIFEREKELVYKDFYFIMSSGDPDRGAMKCAIDGFRSFMRCTPTSREKGIVYGTGVSDKGEISGKPAMQEAYEMGRKI